MIVNQSFFQRSKQIEVISISCFKEIGRILKIRRFREDDYNQMTLLENLKNYEDKKKGNMSNLDDEIIVDDPADKNREIAEKLESNAKKAKEEEKRVISL